MSQQSPLVEVQGLVLTERILENAFPCFACPLGLAVLPWRSRIRRQHQNSSSKALLHKLTLELGPRIHHQNLGDAKDTYPSIDERFPDILWPFGVWSVNQVHLLILGTPANYVHPKPRPILVLHLHQVDPDHVVEPVRLGNGRRSSRLGQLVRFAFRTTEVFAHPVCDLRPTTSQA